MAHSHRQRPEHARARGVGLAFHRPRRTTTLVAAAGMLAASATIAVAGTPPEGPGTLETFSKRNMVAIEGYSAQANQIASIHLLRGADKRLVGAADVQVSEKGFAEINHPGGSCWGTELIDPETQDYPFVTPLIYPGDEVKVTFSGSALTDSMIVTSLLTTGVEGSGWDAAKEAAEPDQVAGTVTLRGTYDPDDPWFDPARAVAEVVNPEMEPDDDLAAADPTYEPGRMGNRAIGATFTEDPTHPNGVDGAYTVRTELDPATGTWFAEWGMYEQVDYDRMLAGDHTAASWMADKGELQSGLHQHELEESAGPGMGGCPPLADAGAPTGEFSATLTTTSGTDTLNVAWAEPVLGPDEQVTGYEVAAQPASTPGQQVVIDTDAASRDVTFVKLDPEPHEVFLTPINGSIHGQPVSVGTITPGEDAVVRNADAPPAEEEQPPPPPPAPEEGALAQPTNLAATPGFDSAELSWAAVPGTETTYTVSVRDAAGVEAFAASGVTATSASATGLVEGTPYTFSVTAHSPTADSSQPATHEFSTRDAAAPAVFTVTRVLAGDTQTVVEWSAAQPGSPTDPVKGYVLEHSQGGVVVETEVGPEARSATTTGLVNGQTYDVAVRALSESGESRAGTAGSDVVLQATPNESASFSRVEYRDKDDVHEWKIVGTASPSVESVLVTNGPDGDPICTANVDPLDRAFTCSVRNSTPRDGTLVYGTTMPGEVVFSGSLTRSR